MTFRPKKWLLYCPVALLPFIAAAALNGNRVIADVAGRAAGSLDQAGAAWAKLTFDGRDATIAGDAPDEAAIETAVRAVAATPGVRRATSLARVVSSSTQQEAP